MMKILILNSGSSTIKFQLIDMPEGTVICSGLVDRIGQKESRVSLKTTDGKYAENLQIPDHGTGLSRVADLLMDEEKGVIQSTDEIEAVGHRVVHGGRHFSRTTVIDNEVKNEIKNLFSLAPLHNPANFSGIEVGERVFSKATQVAVFDTAFHQSIPEKAHRYAIPGELYDQHHIRVYGFHGTSHKYVSEKAIDHMGRSASKLVTLHLGNGCSASAIVNGRSVDHSLGFGPLTGLMMGTRSGDLDPLIIFHLVNQLGYDLEDVNSTLQKKSGLLGITGMSDLREVEEKANDGDQNCKLALDMMTYRIKKYIGGYAAAMNGLDALVFTGGIGENSETIRKMVCSDMEFLGIELNEEKNRQKSDEVLEISGGKSTVRLLVIPTNEELEIARQVYELLG